MTADSKKKNADDSLSASVFLERFGHVVSGLLLGALYFALVLPGALIVQLFRDPLRMKKPKGSTWKAWSGDAKSMSRARRQD